MNPLSFIAEYEYCPRSAFWLLTEVPRYRDENTHIQEGRDAHAILEEEYFRSTKEKTVQSSVRIFSEKFHISGKMDVLEFYKPPLPLGEGWGEGEEIVAVEFKKGKVRENSMHKMQLFLSAVCLEEMFPEKKVNRGAIFFTGDRRKVEFEITGEDKNRAKNLALEVWEKTKNGIEPKDFPMAKDNRCNGCCFWDLCF